MQTVTPMIHVPDIRSTVDWYIDLGFKLVHYNEEDGEMNWAKIAFGSGEVMFNLDGELSDARRREVDLYVIVDDVDGLYERLKDKVDVVQTPQDTFYGTRELIVRDINRFWITFGRPLPQPAG